MNQKSCMHIKNNSISLRWYVGRFVYLFNLEKEKKAMIYL